MSDPTVEFLESLDDPTRWVEGKPMPIFAPHSRRVKRPDGQVETITVTEQDLPTIARNINERFARSGMPVRLTTGHIQPDKATPEQNQPKVLGFAKDARPGTFGPARKPCIWVTPYYRPRYAAEAEEYPFRSAEYYADQQEITGVALLKRDPELDLGVVTNYAREHSYLYAMGATMPDDLMPKPADPTTAPDANAPAPDPDYDKFEGYVKKHPVLNYLCTKYASEASAPAAPALPSGTNTAMPGEKKEPVMMQRSAEAVQYQRERDEARSELDKLRLDNKILAYERDLDKLVASGIIVPNKEQELKDAREMTDAQRARQLERIGVNYAKDPTWTGGTLIKTADKVEGTAGQAKVPQTPEETHKLMQAAERKGIRDVDLAFAAYQRGEISLN